MSNGSEGLKSVYREMMDDYIHEGANTSTNASPRTSCLTPDRQALADSMMNSMESITASVSKFRRGDPPSIYKVPRTIRQVNKVAYSPQIVSIGPYHNGKKKLQAMEEHKWLYLHSFLSRNTKYKLEHYLKAIEELEDEARSYYSEKVDLLMGNEFVKIMMLDACFIVEFFHRAGMFLYDDRIFCTTGMPSLIGYDLLLLENQIPFIVLQRIVKMAYPDKEPHFLAKSARDFFDQFMPMNENIEINDSYYHLLHLFHSRFIPTLTDSEEPNLLCNPTIKYVLNKLKKLFTFLPCSKETSCIPEIKPNLSCNPKIKLKPNLWCNPKIKSVLNEYLKNLLPCSNETPLPTTERREMIPCATDLELAGVKFKKNKKSNNILDVEFSHGELKIPLLLIHDSCESLFRNLIAFEQCYPIANNHFTTYIVFMDCLVNTSKDVALLHQNGIIDNLLGCDDEVAHLFNRLCIGIFHNFEGSYLQDVKDKVQNHYENKWKMWCASWKRKYCTNPWSCISLIAATILLLLTIIQTFFTVFSYFLPPS